MIKSSPTIRKTARSGNADWENGSTFQQLPGKFCEKLAVGAVAVTLSCFLPSLGSSWLDKYELKRNIREPEILMLPLLRGAV